MDRSFEFVRFVNGEVEPAMKLETVEQLTEAYRQMEHKRQFGSRYRFDEAVLEIQRLVDEAADIETLRGLCDDVLNLEWMLSQRRKVSIDHRLTPAKIKTMPVSEFAELLSKPSKAAKIERVLVSVGGRKADPKVAKRRAEVARLHDRKLSHDEIVEKLRSKYPAINANTVSKDLRLAENREK